MDQDPYTNSRLLYKCDRSVATIYSGVMKMAMQEQANEEQLLKEMDSVIFQNFKYKTALLSVQKDHQANEATQNIADSNIEKSKIEIEELNEQAKLAEEIRRKKIEFNELVRSIKQFETHNQLQSKITDIEAQIKEMETEYEREIQSFQEKERCLRLALSALKVFGDS